MGIVQCVTYFNATALLACGRPGLRMWLHFLNATTSLIAIFIALAWGTILAVAVALAIRAALTWPVRVAVTRTVVPFPWGPYLFQLVAPALCSGLMMIAVLLFRGALHPYLPPPVVLALSVAAGVVSYLVLLSVFARSRLREVAGILRTSLPWVR
jgi:hypothetical protein